MRVELASTGQTKVTIGTLNSRPCRHSMMSDNEIFSELLRIFTNLAFFRRSGKHADFGVFYEQPCSKTSSVGFYRASICEGGLGSRNSVRLSVRPSVCLRHACIVTKLNDALQIFLYHTKGQSLYYSDTKSGWSTTPLPSEICVQSDPPPSKNADFDRFPLITSQP